MKMVCVGTNYSSNGDDDAQRRARPMLYKKRYIREKREGVVGGKAERLR